MRAFDPWTATVEEAKAEYIRDRSSFEMWVCCQNLLRFKAPILAKNRQGSPWRGGYALMRAAAYCLTHGIPAPEWLATPFAAKVREVEEGEKRSWDAVFGIPFEKGSRPNRSRITAKLTLKAWALVHAQIAEGIRDRKSIYRAVGKELGLGRDVVERLYKKQQAALDDSDKFNNSLLTPDQ